MKRLVIAIAALSALVSSCREDELVVPAEYDILPVAARPDASPAGMYVLNEGNMGSNKASIDFADFRNAVYCRNIYATANPGVIMELGDVGNDIAVYGSRLYAVINCSHKVEVMDARTLRRIGQVDIPNCRYIKFHGGSAYVSSYVGPVQLDPDARQGAVFRVDTASLAVTGQCAVGYQPDELEIAGGRIYVANSGGYRAPDFDNTLSVIDIATFRQVAKIPVAPNLHRVRADRYGRLWVTSRDDYAGVPSRIFVLEPDAAAMMRVSDTLDIPCSNLAIDGDSLFYIHASADSGARFGVIDIRSATEVSANFISDGTDAGIAMPYGINVDPVSGDVFITDAKNYVSSGTLHCYSRSGRRKWSVRTGDIPSQTAFLQQ